MQRWIRRSLVTFIFAVALGAPIVSQGFAPSQPLDQPQTDQVVLPPGGGGPPPQPPAPPGGCSDGASTDGNNGGPCCRICR
ncbi:MAG: hypothetical protein AAGF95_01930 [Chloroflexota bacterium]